METSKSLRRLASDHASLHNKGLPPNYLFAPSHDDSHLTALSALLAGPESTPYSAGLFQLELSIPSAYPQSPPTAHFRTKIFHPNVDPGTGAICVETLKRDWRPELTLRDILVTISCLLIYPNPSSALNEEAGRMIEEDYGAFEKRAALWTSIHAAVPREMVAKVEEARNRGEVDQKLAKRKGKRLVGAEESRKISGESENGHNQDEALQDPFFSNPGRRPTGLGLGLTTSMQSFHTVEDMEIDSTPVQPPRPRRTRKRYALNAPPEPMPSSSAESFIQPPTTPTPAAPSTVQQCPITPRPHDAKRLRISPPAPIVRQEQRQPPPVWNLGNVARPQQHSIESEPETAGLEIYSWITWYKNIPPSPPESQTTMHAREQASELMMKAAGDNIAKFNSGAFGVRKGIRRL